MMLSVILRHTLLQVQSGDNNKLGKYTHTLIPNMYTHGIRLPSHILVTQYPFISNQSFFHLSLWVSLSLFFSHTDTHTHSLQCLIFQCPFPWSLTCVQVSGWWVSGELRLRYTQTAWTDTAWGLWNQAYDPKFAGSNPWSTWQVSGLASTTAHSLSHQGIFERLTSNCSSGNALRVSRKRLLLDTEVNSLWMNKG